ncbi:tetratricopeptide repeat protein [Marivirga atlantica]|jgi:tetratricopeptide (TPR) repeat protein|uniref:Tetratricopeptide repeat protein n=1 Tax=Marivirga atlantica TaxID=1548457 RepID=A0A937AEA8_9BACT|nr:tetratricopeptide repeat protein [Marivirga atlantica]MBL0764034.1 tetratricopeptide repeat protein [Marivirga atlantica]
MKNIFIITICCALFSLNAFAQNAKIELANAYYQKGENDKALKLYRQLAEDDRNLPFIHNNFLELLELKQLYKEAENYLKKIRAQAPTNIRYNVDIIDYYISINDSAKANQQFESLKDIVLENYNMLRAGAQYLINDQHTAYAQELYLAARKNQRDPNAYAVQLATLYRFANQKDKMVEEYIKYANDEPARIRYVKNMLQLSLKEKEDLENLIQKLMADIQKNPNNDLYSELLIWANLQLKNFYGAFIQARALDKRNKLDGVNSLEIGRVAFENEDYQNAEEIFSYIIDKFPDSKNYLTAREMLILTRQEMVKQNFPVDTTAIRELVKDYQLLIDQLGLNTYTLNAYREKALLHAFYLNEPEIAVDILQQIISYPQVKPDLQAQAKLDLGDIYIILEQPWESTLLYYQVEKSHKNDELGELAKLKNAKVSYYKGDFKLAQEHLDILKKATRREIANNAMDLSILIKNNSILDSTQATLQQYAEIELLLYQNKIDSAEMEIEQMLAQYEEHPIVDELLWLYAKLKKEEGKYEEAITYLQKIVDELPYDILTDDALFEMASIYEKQLNENQLAMDFYQRLLVDFPGSIYVAESRKRFRQLRGDFVN